MNTVFLQMAQDGKGWIWQRAAGISTRFRKLATAQMIASDLNIRLIILDKEGHQLN